jgi:nitrate reductase (NAD(P)H)
MLGTGENVQFRVVNANKSEKDILLHEELDHFESESQGRLKITHVLSHPSDEWKGLRGHVNDEIIKDSLFPPEEGTASFLCGPPTMIQKVALPALKDWGFEEDKNLFGF